MFREVYRNLLRKNHQIIFFKNQINYYIVTYSLLSKNKKQKTKTEQLHIPYSFFFKIVKLYQV